ncbi:MAG: cytochrome c oxidase subunit 3 [Cytophagales bacterium]|nr:cytochrome c oxidase subunit 3 [Cytophagales bacterium]
MENSWTKRREPFQFMLYLGLISSALLFLFIILVFVKKELVNQDIPLKIPKVFWFSTLAILLSSLTIWQAQKSMELQKFKEYRQYIISTYFLALAFLLFQFWGWMDLLNNNVLPSNNTGGSFIFILSGLHVIHTLGGLVALGMVLYNSLKNRSFIDSFVESVNPPNQLRLRLISIYWHFVDVVWIVIFLFLLWHAS